MIKRKEVISFELQWSETRMESKPVLPIRIPILKMPADTTEAVVRSQKKVIINENRNTMFPVSSKQKKRENDSIISEEDSAFEETPYHKART